MALMSKHNFLKGRNIGIRVLILMKTGGVINQVSTCYCCSEQHRSVILEPSEWV